MQNKHEFELFLSTILMGACIGFIVGFFVCNFFIKG